MAARRHIALGDPQAPFATVLEVLDRARLLSETGALRDDVQLVSIGDHFDWGPPSERQRATDDALALLAWLVAHPPEQVVLLAGNHDLARVCELAAFADDAAFGAARAEADQVYRKAPGALDAAQFRARYPFVPDAEALARDFSCFSLEQRRAVELALRSHRFRAAHAHGPRLLLAHAGLTRDDLEAVGGPAEPASATEAAAALNRFFDARVDGWGLGPLDLTPVHQPGSAATGAARGLFFHRPADPARPGADAADFQGPARRRFDPRRLPTGFTQVIGHIRDGKCRELMPAWAVGAPAGDGPLRSLTVEGEAVRYQTGVASHARLVFIDAGMAHAAPGRYQLLDLDSLRPL